MPAVIYLLIANDPALSTGWPIPTATDIAFALGILALVGRGLPPTVRALLLALAVIDDLIAILIIAAFFTTGLAPLPLLLAVPVVLLFGWVSYRTRARWVVPVLILLGVLAWYLVLQSGVHPTIAGVALGLVMADARAHAARIEPWSNVVILPVFAFAAALVPLPSVGIAQLSPAFWGVAIALPVGKLVGITAGALIARALAGRGRPELPFADLLVVAGLGGIGFTVSLLMNELAFESSRVIADQVTIAVLVGSLVSAIVGGALAFRRSRQYLRS